MSVELQKACDRARGEKLWYCERKSGVTEKCMRTVRQGSSLNPFMVTVMVGRLTDEARLDKVFTDDIVIFRDRAEESLGMWRYGLMRSESQQKHHVCK